MSTKQKLDALDFTLNVLREHEKMLDNYENRLQILTRRLENKSNEPKKSFDIIDIISLLKYMPFKSNSFSFYKNDEVEGEYVLLDINYKTKFSIKKIDTESGELRWTISMFEEGENGFEYVESNNFDSESNMFAWLISYIWNRHQ